MSATQDRVDQLLGGVKRSLREIVTPEGVALHVELAEHGERAAAFLIDMTIWLGVAFFSYLVVFAFLVETRAIGIVVTLVLFIGFFVRNLYFIYFELAWQGSTPGKRINRLRVIDRAGGPLTAGAVIARNLTREVEVFLPLGVILSAGAGDIANLVLGLWLALLTAMPLFNRDRMRGGDFIAGTIVIIALPKRLAASPISPNKTRATSSPMSSSPPMAPSNCRCWRNCCASRALSRPRNSWTASATASAARSAGPDPCPRRGRSNSSPNSIPPNAPISSANSFTGAPAPTRTPSRVSRTRLRYARCRRPLWRRAIGRRGRPARPRAERADEDFEGEGDGELRPCRW